MKRTKAKTHTVWISKPRGGYYDLTFEGQKYRVRGKERLGDLTRSLLFDFYARQVNRDDKLRDRVMRELLGEEETG